MSRDILYEAHGQVRLITLNRPKVMNSLDFAANDALTEIWREFAADDGARVAVVTGAGDGAGGGAFCAGADLKTYTMAYANTPEAAFRNRYTNGPGFGGITRGLEIDKPVLAAVNGYAVSGGLELALACDLRFASENAEFAIQDVRWGFHACDGALIRLPWIVGLGHAMELFLSGERIGAAHAYRIGLVNRVFAPEHLMEASMDYAGMLARRAPLAQRRGKRVMLDGLGRRLGDGLRRESASFRTLAETADLAEGTAAFADKREAAFKGE
jgi:enoyl-CoA hydratase/carnithine racemase